MLTLTDDLGTCTQDGDRATMRFERRYPRPIETVWAALTDPARLADWFAPARVEPRLGGRIDLLCDRPVPMVGRILAWEPPHLLEYSWTHKGEGESVVRWELSRDGADTRLLFTHAGVPYPWVGLMLPGWHIYLERLGRMPEVTGTPIDRERFRSLQDDYFGALGLEGAFRNEPICAA